MCDPVSIGLATAAVGATSSIMGFAGQNAASKANQTSANLQYAATQNQLAVKSGQIDTQQSQNTIQALIDRTASQGRISASAAAMGADFATTSRAGNAAAFSAGRNLGIEDTNSAAARLGVAEDSENALYRRQSQINQVLPGNALSLALNLAKSGMSGFSSFSDVGGQLPGTGGDPSISAAMNGNAGTGGGPS